MTGLPYTIAKHDWKTLSALKVLGTNTTDPNQPARYFTRFDEVFEAYSRDYVLFIEPKATEAVEPLRKLLVAQAQPERVVWKHWITSPDFAPAHQHGFTTWAYVLNQPSHIGANLERYAASPDIDMLGAPRDQSDAFCGAVVDAARRNGKTTIMWNIRNEADRTRALSLGCRGLMTSNVKELMAVLNASGPCRRSTGPARTIRFAVSRSPRHCPYRHTRPTCLPTASRIRRGRCSSRSG